jgi:hypothetical protein
MRSLSLPVIIAALACVAGASPEATQTPATPLRTEAFVVLRGFGYGGGGERALRALEPAINAEGMDLLVPDYISRSGLKEGRKRLRRYFDERLARYERVHVFSFIAGGWTLNPLAEETAIPGLATVIYDRSPLQERAPRIADEHLRFLAWLRYGTPLFDVARTPYSPLTDPGVKVGLLVETSPTNFIKKRKQAARSYGAFEFACDAFGQRFDDCMFVDMNHDELYRRFAEVWPDVLAFIRTGRFSSAANRMPPAGDPFAMKERQ